MRSTLIPAALALIFVPLTAAASTCVVESATYGAQRVEMAEKRSGTWVLLDDIAFGDNTIGYGPGGGTAFEATFADGKVWLAQADASQPGGVLGRHSYAPEEGNVFTVTATAASWKTLPDAGPVTDMTELDRLISAAVADLGCAAALLPFRIEAIATAVDWSIESNPEKLTGSFVNEPVILVGIHSSAARDKFFAVDDTDIHVHAIFPRHGFAGHVTAVQLQAGARIQIGQ